MFLRLPRHSEIKDKPIIRINSYNIKYKFKNIKETITLLELMKSLIILNTAVAK